MKYQSHNPEVRDLLDSPRWHQWVDFEIRHINNQLSRADGDKPEPLKSYKDEPKLSGDKVRTVWQHYQEKCDSSGGHEIADLVFAMSELLPTPYHGYLHRGFTSSNVIDSCNHLRWNRLIELMNSTLRSSYCNYGGKIIGVTHGLAACYTSLYHRWSSSLGHPCLKTGIEWLTEVVDGGPTGYNSGGDHRQCFQRWRYWPIWVWLAQIAAASEQLATDYRFYCSGLSSSVGVKGTIKQPVGSSCMPGKANPTAYERVCSVAILVRQLVAAQLALPAQWLDRDLVHSALERETFDQVWDHTFWCVEEMNMLQEGTDLVRIRPPVMHSSFDHLNIALDQGLSYKEAREQATEWPTG